MGENKKVLLNALDQLQEGSASFATSSKPPQPAYIKKEEEKAYQPPLLSDARAGLIRNAETERHSYRVVTPPPA